jgi:nicotinamidase-related amidase
MLEKFFLDRDDALLVIVDIQERLARVMEERDVVVNNCLHLIELARLRSMPVVVTEQYPKGLGPTLPEIADALGDTDPVEKITFSCCGEAGFLEKVRSTERRKIILTGMETHVCVLQTALDLMKDGYIVDLVEDAVTSRRRENKETALRFLRDAGCVVTCTETVLFQILERAGTDEFKSIARRIK